MKKIVLGLAFSAAAMPGIFSTEAVAQTSVKTEPARQFNIPAGDMATALQSWAKISRREVIYRMTDVEQRRTDGVVGELPPMAALTALLAGSGLRVYQSPEGEIAVRPDVLAASGSNATPDILVTAKSGWSLNTGIERTQDDSQPFIVMDRAEIERSGAPNLDTFLRNQLNVNTSPIVGEQVTAAGRLPSKPVGVSAINLRGLGLRDTLILVDGRRQPGVNVSGGSITQPSITGIPIAAVERIEVLASSASGIYGSGASGGVINIVLRRDFQGGELALTYNDTADFKQGQGQIDLTAGLPLEGGRTRLSLTASRVQSDPLRYGARDALRERGIRNNLANNPAFFETGFSTPPNGSLVNYKSSNGTPLRLKPLYGGATLSTAIGTVPQGYRGIQADGIAALLASTGSYNLDQPVSAADIGSQAPLLYGSNQYSGSLALRREFNKAITAYVEIGGSRSKASTFYANTVSSTTLLASSPANPFTQNLAVSLPGGGNDVRIESATSTTRALGGFIAHLPFGWEAVAELSYSTSRYKSDERPAGVTAISSANLLSGVINPLRDTVSFPIALTYDSVPYSSRFDPGKSSILAPSLRLAGKLPLRLPGGQPQVTVNGEFITQRVGAVLQTSWTDASVRQTFIPSARQQTNSVYGEIAFPIFGNSSTIPLMKGLELRFSARHESYTGNGANPLVCSTVRNPPAGFDPSGLCPPPGTTITRAKTKNSHTDPSISLLWTPVRGATIRGSYTTGYLPPSLEQLVRVPFSEIAVRVTDPLRGNEVIGQTAQGTGRISGFAGGNPDVRPESSRTLSAGIILAPRFIDGLRFSADWTRIRKRDVYFDPLTFVGFGGSQAAFDEFLRSNPDRASRGPASGAFTVGPITSLDLSLVNLKALETEAYDFTLSYAHALFGGEVSATGRATYVDSLVTQSFADTAAVENAGVVSRVFATTGAGSGSLRWKGSGSLQWSRDAFSMGWQTRYTDGYYLNARKTIDVNQGAARVKDQIYHDLNISYRFPFAATLRVGINNVFDKKPPFDASAQPLYYSPYGDPRLRSFYLGISKSF